MKLTEIMDEGDYPIAYTLIQDRLKRGEQIKFHSEGTRGLIKSMKPQRNPMRNEPEKDGFEMIYHDINSKGEYTTDRNAFTHVRPTELRDSKLEKQEDGSWHLELPNYDGGTAKRMQKTFKSKNKKDQS